MALTRREWTHRFAYSIVLTLFRIMGLVIGLPAFFQYFNINLDDTQGN